MDREPLVSTGVATAAVTAILTLLVAFGLSITDDQQSAILGVVAVLGPLVAVAFARNKVTPVSDPRGPDGSPLVSAPTADEPFLPGVVDEL